MTEQPSLPQSIMTGLAGRCPRCREGHLFSGFLGVRKECDECGLDYSFADAGDGPAIFVILIRGFHRRRRGADRRGHLSAAVLAARAAVGAADPVGDACCRCGC